MKKRCFQIALSAVSAALATVFMGIGLNVSFAFITGYIFAGIAFMLPLAKNFRAGGLLAYIATSLLCLPIGGIAYFYKLFPFIVFFGLHPLANSLQQKWKINRWVAWAVKAVWFVGMLCASWALFSEFFSLRFDWMANWMYLIIIVGGAAIFLPYDWLMMKAQKLVDFYVAKIDRSAPRGKRPQDGNRLREDVDDVFELSPAQKEEKTDARNDAGDDKREENQENNDHERDS